MTIEILIEDFTPFEETIDIGEARADSLTYLYD